LSRASVRLTMLPRRGRETPVAALAACSVGNGFGNETRRNRGDGVEQAVMA
jgi:hypothetical protein